MFTSALVVALLGFAEPSKSQPIWMTEYYVAQKAAKEKGKPLAVFLGEGKDGWKKLSRKGQLSEEALKVLASDYTCVFVDTKHKEGKELAQAFEFEEGLGLVISDRTGDLQAFRHEGDLADATLVRYLERFADPNLVVRATVSNPSQESSSQTSGQTYYRRPVFQNFSMRGGC
jgi:hypothetical protein